MTITTSSFSKALQKGAVEKWVNVALKEKPAQWPKVFKKEGMTKAFVEEVMFVGTGLAPVKPEGNKITFDDMQQGWIARYTAITNALGFTITREMREDNQYAEISFRKSRALGYSMRQTQEYKCWNVLNRAFNTAYTMGANHDSKPLCANDHPFYTGGTYSNVLATPADLSTAALEQATIEIAAWRTEKGLNFPIKVTKLIIHPSEEFTAATALESVLLPGTSNNDINALRITNKIPEGYFVSDYLSDEDAWFLQTDHPDGLKYKVRRDIEMTNDSDSQTQNSMHMASERSIAGWTDPHGIFGCPGV